MKRWLVFSTLSIQVLNTSLAHTTEQSFERFNGKYLITKGYWDMSLTSSIEFGDIFHISNNKISITDKNETIVKYEIDIVGGKCLTQKECESYGHFSFNKLPSGDEGIFFNESPYPYEFRDIGFLKKNNQNFYYSDCEKWDTGGSGCRFDIKLKKIDN